jgi:hypothetical protein
MPGMSIMVTVTLKSEWTDAAGIGHPSGAIVRIPEAQLDELVTAGVVATDASENWVTCD